MISTKILKSLESNEQDPSYSIIISKFDQPEFCNKDQLNIYMEQINPSFEEIIENNHNIIEELKALLEANNIEVPEQYVSTINSCVQKTLKIESILDYNTKDGLFISGLTGSLENDVEKGIINRYVEGYVQNKRVRITQNDVPNHFNKHRFKIKGDQLIINVPKKVSEINVTITENDTETTYTSQNIINQNIYIPLDLEKEYFFTIRYLINPDILTQQIESIVTPLAPTLDIQFSNQYQQIPAIIPTIDKDDKIYSSYTTNFEKNENGLYTGVSITFKGLKRQRKYGNINITIIGK